MGTKFTAFALLPQLYPQDFVVFLICNQFYFEFAKLRALRAFVPSYLTRLRALRAFAPYVPRFLRSLIMRLARLICYLRPLFTRDINSLMKDNFKMF